MEDLLVGKYFFHQWLVGLKRVDHWFGVVSQRINSDHYLVDLLEDDLTYKGHSKVVPVSIFTDEVNAQSMNARWTTFHTLESITAFVKQRSKL